MSTITINFTDEERASIAQLAQESGIPAEELVCRSVLSVVSPREEESFNDIKTYLLARYGSVYRKLA